MCFLILSSVDWRDTRGPSMRAFGRTSVTSVEWGLASSMSSRTTSHDTPTISHTPAINVHIEHTTKSIFSVRINYSRLGTVHLTSTRRGVVLKWTRADGGGSQLHVDIHTEY